MSSRPAWLITGNFDLRFSPNGFAISLARSNHPPINARSAPCSKRNKSEVTAMVGTARGAVQTPQRVSNVELLTRSRYWDNDFAVLFCYEVFGAARRAAA